MERKEIRAILWEVTKELINGGNLLNTENRAKFAQIEDECVYLYLFYSFINICYSFQKNAFLHSNVFHNLNVYLFWFAE